MAETVKKKILVIDDNHDVSHWVISVLAAEGYECLEAQDGEMGVTVAGIFLPDLILCDVEMPKIDGFEVLTRISKNPRTAGIPFIYMTARSLREDVRRGMALGADDYLTKPFSRQELLDTVRARITKKHAQEKQSEAKVQKAKDTISKQNAYDALTRLPNRQTLLKQIRENDLTTGPGRTIAILSIGIDNLRHITEAFGTRCEEVVLCAAVARMKKYIDFETSLYRGKHDSFDLVVRNTEEEKKLETLMKDIFQDLSESFSFKKHVFRKKISIGCAFYRVQSKESAEMALNHAETARHQARKEGEKGWCFYREEMQKSLVDQLTLENHLFRALKNKELKLFYQPQVDIGTRKVKAVEALIRWTSPALGMVLPLQFIPIAEQNGLIIPIGEWVLEESCRQIREWQKNNLDLKVAVNISGRQLESGGLVAAVEAAMNQSGVSPSALELEITESLLLEDFQSTLTQMKSLVDQGVMIAIDDFGTGYSSLSSLKKFPFSTLKIDRSFIRDIETHASNTEIVAAIIRMAHTLKLKTVAEGVETNEQLECLKKFECDEYQGYFFSRPVPPAEILPLCLKNRE